MGSHQGHGQALRDSSAAKETSDPMNQSILKASAGSPREDAGKRVRLSPIGFGFISDWIRKWQEFSKPITNE